MPVGKSEKSAPSKTPIYCSAVLLLLVLTPIAEAGRSNAPQHHLPALFGRI